MKRENSIPLINIHRKSVRVFQKKSEKMNGGKKITGDHAPSYSSAYQVQFISICGAWDDWVWFQPSASTQSSNLHFLIASAFTVQINPDIQERWQVPQALVAMFPEPFPERGTTLMKDFYTKLFPERSRSRSGTRNMERGTRNVATFHVPGFYALNPLMFELS